MYILCSDHLYTVQCTINATSLYYSAMAAIVCIFSGKVGLCKNEVLTVLEVKNRFTLVWSTRFCSNDSHCLFKLSFGGGGLRSGRERPGGW